MKPRRIRRAARILVLDPLDHLLLFRFTPGDRPALWATVGGEVDEQEDFQTAARRELREETGVIAEVGDVIAIRESDFVTFAGEPVHAIEHYFGVRVADRTLDFALHTETEKQVMQHHAWFSQTEISQIAEAVFPVDLEEIVRLAIEPFNPRTMRMANGQPGI